MARKVVIVGGRIAALETLLRPEGTNSDNSIAARSEKIPVLNDPKSFEPKLKFNGLGFWKFLQVDQSVWVYGKYEDESFINIKRVFGNGFEVGRIYGQLPNDGVEIDYSIGSVYSEKRKKKVVEMDLGNIFFRESVNVNPQELMFGKSRVGRGLLELIRGREITIITSSAFIEGFLKKLVGRMNLKGIEVELRHQKED